LTGYFRHRYGLPQSTHFLSNCVSCFLSFSCHHDHRALHPFPTRRSSDLLRPRQRRSDRGPGHVRRGPASDPRRRGIQLITKRRRSIAAVAASALAGAALGAGGITAALWFDSAHAGGQISSGYEYFAAGIVKSSDSPDDDSDRSTGDDDSEVTVTIGSDHAQELVDDGSIAIPLSTDSISQGNKGLTYTSTQPNWGDGVFGYWKPYIFSVEKARDCAVDRAPSSPPGDLTS